MNDLSVLLHSKFGAAGHTLFGVTPTGTAVMALRRLGVRAVTTEKALYDDAVWDGVDANTVVAINDVDIIGVETMNLLAGFAKARGAQVAAVFSDGIQ